MRVEHHSGIIRIQAPAKVNLFLELLGKRPDGYHDICTCFVAVSLWDLVDFEEEASEAIHLSCDDPAVPPGETNLIVKAARLLRERMVPTRRGAKIRLSKRIPMQAGLGGGSSDAAAALVGLRQLWQLPLVDAELARLAAELGSDVPFFLNGNAAWGTGRGEILEPITLPIPLYFVLVCPPRGLSTAEVYRRSRVPDEPVSSEPLRRALQQGDVEAIGAALHNRLQEAAEELAPEVACVRRLFEQLRPVGHRMSGSGSTYFALCRSLSEAETLAEQVRDYLSREGLQSSSGLSWRVFVVHSETGN